MENQIVNIDTKIRDYIEGLDYELASRKELVAYMLENNMNVNTDSFKKYSAEMAEYSAKFKLAKKELEKQYVLPIIGDKKVSWKLDYASCELTITYIED